MSNCKTIRERFTEYLDSRLTGREMQRISSHLSSCRACQQEWQALQQTQSLLAELGPMHPPEDLLLGIRVAVSQERARQQKNLWSVWKLVWANTLGPFLLQATAGFASAVLLMGTVVMLATLFAEPETARAMADEPLGMATGPRFLYMSSVVGENQIGELTGPVVVEAFINGSGEVYDYRIVSGPTDETTKSQVETLLLWSRFEPARRFGQPVSGLAVLSFSGVAVRG